MKTGAGSKAKGASFERVVCVKLSLWVSDGKRRDLYWRSALSGGRATVSRGEVRQCGDISCVASEGHVLTDRYFIECKHVRDLRLEVFTLEDKGPLAQFWRKACTEAARYQREPVLIAKGNRMPTLVLTQLNCKFNPRPVALIRDCALGMFERIIKEPFHGASASKEQQHRSDWIRP